MFAFVVPLLMAILSQGAPIAAVADGAGSRIDDRWLMMVTTSSTDPGREDDFNAWYDDIDIPDVLEVPGYMRARRGVGQRVPAFPGADLQGDEGKYIALYDIVADDMDKTIIDMMMASRKMEMRGRSTDLLRVVERVYYRQYSPTYEAPDPQPSGKNTYLYVVKVACCSDQDAQREFNDWYDTAHLPDIMETDGFVRATRYELYRVLMVDPVYVPDYLTVYEVEAESAAGALQDLHERVDELAAAGRMNPLYAEGGATIYLQIKDVPRP